MKEDQMLYDINKKVSFCYELNDKIYAIGHQKIFDYAHSRIIAPNYKMLFDRYKEYVSLYRNNEKMDITQTGYLMFELISISKGELDYDNNTKYIVDFNIFWNNLNSQEQELLYNQMRDFEDLFYSIGLADMYPGISNY